MAQRVALRGGNAGGGDTDSEHGGYIVQMPRLGLRQ
jgi:hypothetical protein